MVTVCSSVKEGLCVRFEHRFPSCSEDHDALARRALFVFASAGQVCYSVADGGSEGFDRAQLSQEL